MKKRSIILLLCAFFASLSFVHAEWNPEYCFVEEEPSFFDKLNDKDYIALKASVLKGLEGSWCSAEKVNLLMDLTLLTKPKVCVEIGAFTGSSVLPVAATLKFAGKGRIYAVDAWSNEEAVRHLDADDPNRPWWSTINMDWVFSQFQNLVNEWRIGAYCYPIRKPSAIAAREINNIDLLHLDGNFSEQGALEDVMQYLPKVKSGGYILLSNLFLMSKGKQPKLKSFSALFAECEIVAEIERDNAVLFKKN